MDEINQNEDIPNFIEFNLDAEKIKTENLKEEIKKDSYSNVNYNLENISSFDSNEFCKMDLKNSFELVNNKGFTSDAKSVIPNNFDDNLNLDNFENDFIIQNDFKNFIKNKHNNNNKNVNDDFNNDFDNLDNLVIDFNTNVHLHTDNINSIDNIDKSKINKMLHEKENRKSSNRNAKNNDKKNYKNSAFETKAKKDENKNSQIKKKKIDLDRTPLPIFACIYCSNENIVFTHMSNEIISDKYLYNCSPQDLKNINLIVSTYFVYNLNTSRNAQIKSLVNIVLNYSEFLSKMHPTEKSKEIIKNYTEKFTRESEENINENPASYKPLLKYRFFCSENTMMTFFFKNTSNFNLSYTIN